MNATRILLYCNEPVLAIGLGLAIDRVDSFQLLPQCCTVGGLTERITNDSPDLVLMDLTREVTVALLSDMKHAMLTCKVVLWVDMISTEFAFQAMGMGVRGILSKSLSVDQHLECLQKIAAGELWFEKDLADSLLSANRVALTGREGQIVSLVTQRLKNKEIATTLMVSEGAVKVYLHQLFQKVGVRSRTQLALFGLKNLTNGQLPVDQNGQRKPVATVPGLRSLVIERPVELDKPATPTFPVQTTTPRFISAADVLRQRR